MPRIPAGKAKPETHDDYAEHVDAPVPQATIPPPPPKPEPAPRSVSEILRRRSEEAAVLVAAAEEVLTALAKGQSLSTDERSLLTSMGLIGDRLESEVRRMTRILNWQGRAGTADDREQATAAAEAAAAEVAKRGPEIDAEIERLQAEKASLESTAESTQRTCQWQAEAVKALRVREFLPEHLQGELDALARQMTPVKARRNTLQGEIDATERLAVLDPTDKAVVGFAEHHRLPCFNESIDRQSIIRTVDATGWRSYLDQRRVDDERRRAEIAEVQAELEPLIEKQKALLSHYVP